jgi:RNA polymerase sigma factor (sigma-70 family)
MMKSSTSATLLDRLRDGRDGLAWDEFFQRYWLLIYTYASRRGCSSHTAEEIVQDVMLKLFERKDVFRYDPERGRFRDWLATVVRNKVAELRRRPAARDRASGGIGCGDLSYGNLPELADDGCAPDDIWESAFEQSLLWALLEVVRQEMDPRCYLAFEMTVLNELPADKVATHLDMSRSTVSRTRKKVLSRLEQLGAAYRRGGHLPEQVKQALLSRPDPAVERSLAHRIETTMLSR